MGAGRVTAPAAPCYVEAAMHVGEERVWAVVEAARRVAGDPALAPRLVASTGLSAAGVALALARHLELAPAAEDVAALVARTVRAPAVTVILSANVFVGALRAVALAVAAAPRVLVRPSRRDPAFAEALVAALPGALGVTLAPALAVEEAPPGELHVYGRDATIADVRRRTPSGVRVRGHGAGLGVALAASPEGAAALAEDVVAFDQRGCLSPRAVLVRGDAAAFAEALHAALGASAVPRGRLDPEERAEAERYRATMTYAGRVLAGPEHVVGLAEPGAPLVVPPPGRHVHVVPVADLAVARAYLAPLAPALTTVGSDDVAALAAVAPAWARRAALGSMQRPPLDGPVDLRRDDGR